ncbi:MAG: SusE domain-containing protein [Bacteroidota bacterium]|nr:SusE domain-containing protein [Bacteroidota bacterium]
MYKIYNRIFCLFVVLLLLASCKKEGAQFFIKNGSFPAGGLTASSDSVLLTKSTESDTAITFKWPASDFGQKPVVSYTLQIDVPADTSGSTGWGKAKNFSVGNALSYMFIGKDLNNLLISLGLSGGNKSETVVRIKADVPQNTGSPSSIASAYSNTLVLQVTPYNLSLFIPGAYQGWSPPTAPLLNPVAGRAGLYEAYEYMPGSGPQYFKYTNAPDWNHTNYGDGGNGTFSTDGNAGGLSVPDGGYYEVTADFNKNTWTATKTTWGIIGDATPGGWSNDTQMTYDVVNQVWKVTCDMKHNGSFKFRANNAWNIDFGIDNKGNLVYADNPFFGYTANLNNLSVPADGNYTITLDLHISGVYNYTLVKN